MHYNWNHAYLKKNSWYFIWVRRMSSQYSSFRVAVTTISHGKICSSIRGSANNVIIRLLLKRITLTYFVKHILFAIIVIDSSTMNELLSEKLLVSFLNKSGQKNQFAWVVKNTEFLGGERANEKRDLWNWRLIINVNLDRAPSKSFSCFFLNLQFALQGKGWAVNIKVTHTSIYCSWTSD